MPAQGTHPNEHHFHGGPFAGEFFPRDNLPRQALDRGRWPLRYQRWRGTYIRDEGSAGGRDWDWRND